MATIPNFERAVIAAAKLGGYLLSDIHKVGAPKYTFLRSFGFAASRPEELEAALLAHGATNPASTSATEFGLRYEVDGPLSTPLGLTPQVRTVWQEHKEGPNLRFVTLVPK